MQLLLRGKVVLSADSAMIYWHDCVSPSFVPLDKVLRETQSAERRLGIETSRSSPHPQGVSRLPNKPKRRA
jgi:hypothetical protein